MGAIHVLGTGTAGSEKRTLCGRGGIYGVLAHPPSWFAQHPYPDAVRADVCLTCAQRSSIGILACLKGKSGNNRVMSQTATDRPRKRKNPHAVALGRKGGIASGKTRFRSIPEEVRIELARRAGIASGKARARKARLRKMEEALREDGR